MSRVALVDLMLRDPAALVIVKATAVLALASAAAASATGFSAARRHVLWLVALSSCVWLILTSPVVPAIVIHTPMLAQEVTPTATRPIAAAPPTSRDAPVANASPERKQIPAIETVRRASARSIPLPSHPLITLWIIGCVALLTRHAIGFVRATRIARRASIVNADETARELAGVTAAVGVRREVRLGYSPEVQSPITLGVMNPYVLLPTEATSWSIERRRAVLVHEAAHVVRGDWLSQAFGQLACELFWFHPLVWRAFSRLRDEAERAADDCVLRSGMPACEYAKHLLELARRTTHSGPDLVAVGIVSTNDLERRFVAMFDSKRSRATVTSQARALTASVALAIVCPLASLRVAAPVRQIDAPLQHASVAHASTPQPSNSLRGAADERDTARVARIPEVRFAIMRQLVQETAHPSVAVVEHSAPGSGVHPDLSGKWRSDTVAVPPRAVNFFVTDSLLIKQSDDSIALDSRGHELDDPYHHLVHGITFDGLETSGVDVDGRQSHATNVVVSAVWAGDTLVMTSRIVALGTTAHTVERLTLSADGNTLSSTSLNYVDGRPRADGPHAYVLRRMTP